MYKQALNYLNSFINFERLPFEYKRQFNLKRIGLLLHWFGSPQQLFPSVLIAGTKGKGSTAIFLNHILMANGCKTGVYTSPHLTDPRERIRVNGKLISKSDFARLVNKIRSVLRFREREIKEYEPITYFEIFTLLAILYFAEQKIELGIFEVGMGGRLDATNVLDPLISIVTSISYDHQEHLGSTLREIAREKAAIIKKKGTLISARQAKEAEAVLKHTVKKQQANGFFYGEEFRTSGENISEDGARFHFQTKRQPVIPRHSEAEGRRIHVSFPHALSGNPRFGSPIKTFGDDSCLRLRMTESIPYAIPLTGTFQIENAALALQAARILSEQYGFKIRDASTQRGLKQVFWPGRFERVSRHGRVFILDGAHNGASMKALGDTLKILYPKKRLLVIFGTSREKKLSDQLKEILPLAGILIVTKSAHPRAQEPRVILDAASSLTFNRPSFLTLRLKDALAVARQVSTSNDMIVVTGSLFLIGETREILKCRKFI